MPSPVPYLSMNGKIVAYEKATIHMLTPTIKYGAAVFEGIRGYWNAEREQLYLFRLDDHLLRLQYAMRFMRFDEVFSVEQMRRAVIELIQANRLRDTIHIRLFAYLDGVGELTATGPIGLAIAALPRSDTLARPRGLNVNVSSWRRLSDATMPPRVKCISNYQNSRLAGLEAKAGGYDYALLLNAAGKVSEGQTSCFFMVHRGGLITPSTSEDILESITRDTVLSIARGDLMLATQERPVDRSELHAADEAFLCGSGPEIKPLLTIDRLPVGSGECGPITGKIIDRYRDIVRGLTDDHADWRTPVYA